MGFTAETGLYLCLTFGVSILALWGMLELLWGRSDRRHRGDQVCRDITEEKETPTP